MYALSLFASLGVCAACVRPLLARMLAALLACLLFVLFELLRVPQKSVFCFLFEWSPTCVRSYLVFMSSTLHSMDPGVSATAWMAVLATLVTPLTWLRSFSKLAYVDAHSPCAPNPDVHVRWATVFCVCHMVAHSAYAYPDSRAQVHVHARGRGTRSRCAPHPPPRSPSPHPSAPRACVRCARDLACPCVS